jgi:hypothetical protein
MKNRDALFNYSQDLEEPLADIKNIRATKTKFLRDLYYKTNSGHRTERNNKILSNSKDK